MDNNALKAAAQKELMRRAAKAELDRRAQSQPNQQPALQASQEAAPNQGPSMMDLAYGLTPMGAAQNIKNAVMNPRQTLQTADNVVRTAANAMTGGYADKFSAYMGGGNVEDERAKSNKAYSELGAAGPVVEAGAFMLPASALAKVGLTASALPKVGGLLGTTIDSAVYGGINAAGHDQNIGEGAMLGAGLGAVGQGLGHLIGKAGQYTGDFIKNMGLGTREQAINKVLSVAQNAGLTRSQAVQKLNELGPDAMLADLLGKHGQSLGRAAGNVNPAAREILDAATSARKAGQNDRLIGTLEQASGLPVGSRKSVDTLKKEYYDSVSPEINRAYRTAKAAGYDVDLNKFNDILQTPMGRSALTEGRQATQNRAFANQVPDAVVSQPVQPKAYNPRGVASSLAKEYAPSIGPRPARPPDLIDFVAAKGGLRDSGGELRSLDLGSTSHGRKALRQQSGRDLDAMRELAVEAGYFDQQFGSRAKAQSESTVADFLQLLDQSHRERNVFASHDMNNVDDWLRYKDAQQNRWEARSRIADFTRNVDAPISDGNLKSAFNDYASGRTNAKAAIEEAKFNDHVIYGSEPMTVPNGMNGETVRNFSNLELLDNTKRAFDDIAGSSYRAGLNDKGSQAAMLAKTLRERADALVPEYGGARALRQKAYAGENAFDVGEKLASGRVPIDLPLQAQKIDPEFEKFMAQAYAAKQAENLLNKGSTENAINSFMRGGHKEASKAALRDKQYMLDRQLNNERTFNQTHKGFTGNSTTAQQFLDTAGGGILGMGAAISTGQDWKTGGVSGALLGAGRRYGPSIASSIARNKTRMMAPDIAEILTTRALPNTPSNGVKGLLGDAISKLSSEKKKELARLLSASGAMMGANYISHQ